MIKIKSGYLAIIILASLAAGYHMAILQIMLGDANIISYQADEYDKIAQDAIGQPILDIERTYGPSTDYGERLFPYWDRVHQLGPEPSLFAIDYAWLLVRIDENSKVVEAKIGTD
jgi:hypothetical protein